MTDENILDVAIVGGGLSGVYSAWRLLTDGGKKSVTVYEADKHIGGRLLSVKPPNIDNMVAELGGMRILPPEIQPLVNTLIWKLNEIAKDPQSGIQRLDLYEFPVNGKYAPDKWTSDNIVFTRGTSFRWSDIENNSEKFPIPYQLRNDEKNQSLGNLILNAIKKIIPDIDENDPPEINRKKAQQACYPPNDGLPLYQQGFWDVLIQVMSYEAYRFEQDAGGYLTTLSNWNAADAIPWFLADFNPQATYRGFAQGYRQVVVNMAQLFTNAGGNIVCDQKLASFDWDGNVFTLNFANGDIVTAKALILAMPRRSLELISCGNDYLSDDATSKLIKSVTPKSAFKIFSTYDKPWWKKVKNFNLSLGRSLTDLPLRQTYYWTDSQGKAIEDGPAMLMASYDDGTNTEFWDGYRNLSNAQQKAIRQHTENSSLTDASGEPQWTDNAPQWADYPATQSMSDEMTQQLAEIHGVDVKEIQPESVCFKDWSDDPFGGGWNFWNIGVQSPDVMKAIIKPDSTVPLYICGDAYSNWQGWVEGALETANMVLAKLNVKPIYRDIEIITPAKLKIGFLQERYDDVKLEAIGGYPSSLTWKQVGGNFPPGLSLSSDGIISGICQNTGTFEFNVVASDPATGKSSAVQQFSMEVHIHVNN